MITKKYTLFLIIFSFAFSAFSQIDSTKSKSWLYLPKGSPYDFPPFVESSTISLIPEIQGGSNLFLSIGISKEKTKIYRKGITTANGIMAGIEYNPFQKIYAPKLTYWRQTVFGNFRINSLYYLEQDRKHIAFRPEIGIGFPNLKLFLGYNLFLKQRTDGINRFMGCIVYRFHVLPLREEKN